MNYNFKVNDDYFDGQPSNSSISSDSSGKFIITWTIDRGSNKDIYAQRYLDNGARLDSNFLVTTSDEWTQQFPAVALMNDRIFTVWEDNRGGQTGYDIWANVLSWDLTVGVENHTPQEVPSGYFLFQNFPNPFNPVTTIRYQIPKEGIVSLKIYDVLGRELKTLVNEYEEAGSYKLNFDGSEFSSGIYFYRLCSGNFIKTMKMILVK